MENTVKERLTLFLRCKKISKTEFGRRIGVSSAFVSSMRKSIQPEKIKSIAIEFPELNTEWLLTGQGEMLKSPTPATVRVDDSVSRLLDIIESQQRTIESLTRQLTSKM